MSAPVVSAHDLDLSVYGQVQRSYSISTGETNLDLGTTASLIGYYRAVGVENEITVLSAGLKKRSQTLSDLNEALKDVIVAISTKKQKEAQDAKVDFNKSTYASTFNRYGVKMTDDKGNDLWESNGTQIKLGNLNQLQQHIKLVLDKEDNALQRVSSQLQSAITKRDSSYTQMEKFLKKFDGTAGAIIGNIGK